MYGRQMQDLHSVAVSPIQAYGGHALYQKRWFMDYAFLPQYLVAGPSPKRAVSLHNIYNVIPWQVKQQIPPQTRDLNFPRYLSRHIFLPLGPANQMQGGSQ